VTPLLNFRPAFPSKTTLITFYYSLLKSSDVKKLLHLFTLTFILVFASSCDDQPYIDTTQGNVSFWTNAPAINGIDIFINDEYKGSLEEHLRDSPDCGEIGALTLDLAPGTYTYKAYQRDFYEWEGSLTVSSASCVNKLLN